MPPRPKQQNCEFLSRDLHTGQFLPKSLFPNEGAEQNATDCMHKGLLEEANTREYAYAGHTTMISPCPLILVIIHCCTGSWNVQICQ